MIKPTHSLGQIIAQRYRIVGALGQGAFGTVYDALELATGQRVALKVLRSRMKYGSAPYVRFEREAELVAKLKHPNIVRLLDAGQTEIGSPFIAFELLLGHSLTEELQRGEPLPYRQAGEIARQTLLGLRYAHGFGVVHRDIKPGNIFICHGEHERAESAAPTIKILDFGIAKALWGDDSQEGPLTAVGQVIGTPLFMAPEQLRGGAINQTADLYSLGLVMAALLVGQPMAATYEPTEVYRFHLSAEPLALPPPVRASPLSPIIAQAVEKSRVARYKSADDMLAELETRLTASAKLVSAIAAPTANERPTRKPTHRDKAPRSSPTIPAPALAQSAGGPPRKKTPTVPASPLGPQRPPSSAELAPGPTDEAGQAPTVDTFEETEREPQSVTMPVPAKSPDSRSITNRVPPKGNDAQPPPSRSVTVPAPPLQVSKPAQQTTLSAAQTVDPDDRTKRMPAVERAGEPAEPETLDRKRPQDDGHGDAKDAKTRQFSRHYLADPAPKRPVTPAALSDELLDDDDSTLRR